MTEPPCKSVGLIGVAYLPHGTMILDPDREDLPTAAKLLHSSCMKISEKIAELNLDLIILLTPHGTNLHHSINVYQPSVPSCIASGNAEWKEQWFNYSVDVELDGDASKSLYHYLKQNLPMVQGMLAFAGLSVPLRWGEVVPLYFALHELVRRKGDSHSMILKKVSLRSHPKVVIIAQPARGTTAEEKELFYKERSSLIQFGRLIRLWCDKSNQRILLVISGDQAHTHPFSSQIPIIYQPDPSSRIPESDTAHAQQFDDTIQNWITGTNVNSHNKLYRLDERLVFQDAGSIERYALSCGYTGSLTMQGVMENDLIENRIDGSNESIDPSANWLLTDFISCHPTYYGMMAALCIRNIQ